MDAWRHRRSIRLQRFDYSQRGAYFVTVCVKDRKPLLGTVSDGGMRLSAAGQVLERIWLELPVRFPGVQPDAFVVMPEHLHGILHLGAPAKGVMNHAPTELGEVVRTFKAVTCRLIRQGGLPSFSWQRNYFGRVVRDEAELEALREYIRLNPARRLAKT